MSIVSDLLTAAPFVLPVAAGVALLALYGRDRDDESYTVDDYREPAPADPARSLRQVDAATEVLPVVSRTPVFDAMAARPYVPLDDAGVRALASLWLAEIGERERAKAGILRSPATDRDLTGVFPVVAVA